MSLIPKTLLGRTALIIGGMLILSELATFKLFELYYQGPLIKQIADLAVSQIRTVGIALTTLKGEARDDFLDHLEEREGIRVLFDNDSVLPSKLPDSTLLLNFTDEVRRQLGKDIEFFVQPQQGRALWVKLPVAQEKFWIAIPRSQIELGFPWLWLALASSAALLALLAATWLVRRVNRPLRELANATVVLGKGDYPEPLKETGPKEISQLSRSFNQMLTDVQNLDQERAVLLAGISHDLRTPLARMRLATEMLSGDADLKQNMAQDIDELDAIVKQFLDYARVGSQEQPQLTDLNELVREVCESHEHRGTAIQLALGDVAKFSFRVTAVKRALTNLIDNAEKYGQIPIEISTRTENNRVLLNVRDHGPGIAAEDRDRLLRPFTRLNDARSGPSGAGLGLAIVNRVAKLHGGEFTLATHRDGGLEAMISLPLYAPQLPT